VNGGAQGVEDGVHGGENAGLGEEKNHMKSRRGNRDRVSRENSCEMKEFHEPKEKSREQGTCRQRSGREKK